MIVQSSICLWNEDPFDINHAVNGSLDLPNGGMGK